MDGFSGKRVVGGLGLSRSSALSFRDGNQEDRKSQCCNRIGCSTRHSSARTIQNNDVEKFKYLKPPFRFTNKNSFTASSSQLFSPPSNIRKYYFERKNKASVKEADVAESSTRKSDIKADLKWESEFCRGVETEPFDLQSSSPTSESSPGSRNGKQINRRFGSVIQDTASSFLRRSSTPRFVNQAPKTSLNRISGRPQKYSMSKIGCASISDVVPSDSSSECNTKGVYVGRKLQYGEGSSKAVLSQPEYQVSARNQPGKGGVVSVRTRGSSSGSLNSRIGSSKQENESTSQQHHAQLSILDDSSQDSMSTGRTRPGSRSSQDDYRPFNMEGIAEVLLALERIEQDEELTNEQLLVLEANLFLESLSFYDQHRDMRLDIDNMSYEELLALEEKMGTVCTALSEDALSKCIRRTTYRPSFIFSGFSSHGDDVKCSICQEEYSIGVEVGRLSCEHRYHVECIRQWLRLKNWCPICKVTAASSAIELQS